MRLMQNYNFSGKTALVRCDFNVPLRGGAVSDNFRLLNHLPTVNYLIGQKAKVVLLAHRQAKQEKKPSLRILCNDLAKIFKTEIVFLKNGPGAAVERQIKKAEAGSVFLLENLRFDKGEEANSKIFAKKLANLGDVFVQDSFSVCHRVHSSVIELAKILPSLAGLALQKEIAVFQKTLENPSRPLTFIVGGAKIADKIKPIGRLLSIADNIIFGGRLIEEILSVKGVIIGKPWPAEAVIRAIKLISLTDQKIHLPVDVLVSPDLSGQIYVRRCAPGNVRKEEQIFDIAEDSIEKFREVIKESKTIFWTGVLGLVENEVFAKGTEEIALAIAKNNNCFKVAGGGDTVGFIRRIDLADGFSHLSTAGSALTEYIANGTLPGIAVLS